MTDPLLLYGMNSPNVRKVVIMLEELGLTYELRHVSVFGGEQFTPDFLALNPLGKVPVLVDPELGAPLAESGAILFWLAERSGGEFLPTTRPERYEVMQWLMVQMANYGPLLGQLNHFQLVPAGERAYALGRYRSMAERLYRLLDERLADREWIAGGACSIADFAMYPWAHYLERHGFDPAANPALVAWRTRIDGRPAVQRAAERMDAAFTAASTEARRNATDESLDRFFGRTAEMPAVDYASLRQ